VSDLNLSDGGKNAPRLRPGWYTDSSGQRVEQPMQRADGVQKGVKSILQERGLWPAAGIALKQARELLSMSQQPDFQQQRGRIVERLMAAQQHIIMLPKFHCEFNFIENVWGRMKAYLRRNCKYDFEALQRDIPLAVASVPLPAIRRYAQRCDRYMDASRVKDGGVLLTPQQVARAVKIYKSHRSIPGNIIALFPELLHIK